MIYPGMPRDDYFAILRDSHNVRVRVIMMDTDHAILDYLTDRLIDGTVDIDAEGDVTRSLSMTLMDPDHDLNLDTFKHANGKPYYTTMFRISYDIKKFTDVDYVNVPIFTGPITSLDRDGGLLNIECASKEIMASEGLWSGRSWLAGTRKREVIKNGMQELFGENFFDMDQIASDLGHDWSLKRGDDAWERFQNLAKNMSCQLYYTGKGELRLRKRNLDPVFTFTEQWLTSIPHVGYDLESVRNAVRVTGGRNVGDSANYWFSVTAQDSHPLSPYSLRRNGVRRYLPVFIEDDSLKTIGETQEAAFTELHKGLVKSSNVEFAALVNPLLEEGDMISIWGGGYFGKTEFAEASIPLAGDAEMSVGFMSESKSPSKKRLREVANIKHTPMSRVRKYDLEHPKKKKRGKRKKKKGS